jgi:hypothetical protein
MGDKDGARTQLDLVLSGKHLEVNAAGRKVRVQRIFLIKKILIPQPHSQGKYSLEVCCHDLVIVVSCLAHRSF